MPKQTALEKALERHIQGFVDYLNQTRPATATQVATGGAPQPEVAQAVASVALYESSKRLEIYSKALIVLTAALVALTITLILRP